MSVYNGELFVARAIDSILAQTLHNFELILINDGSTDGTQAILDTYSDPRIVQVKQSNHGLIYSLNKGIGLARADLIARHDADDVSEPSRFKKQVQVFKKHARVSVVGSAFMLTTVDDVDVAAFVPPIADVDIRRQMFTRNPLCHGSVMMRTAAVREVGGYSRTTSVAEDYDLWIRLAQAGHGFANLPEPLYRWQHNPLGISWNNDAKQAKEVEALRAALWKSQSVPVQSITTLVHRVWHIRLHQSQYAGQSARQLALDQWRLMRLSLRYRAYAQALRAALTYICMIPFNITAIGEWLWLTTKQFLRRSKHSVGQLLRSGSAPA
jgi:glycosyltransferase involved in cell wall biosynthesis